MSFLLTGPAATIVGAGLQAVGLGIPVSDTAGAVLDGARSFGLPIPPKTWFKTTGSNRARAHSASSSIAGSYDRPFLAVPALVGRAARRYSDSDRTERPSCSDGTSCKKKGGRCNSSRDVRYKKSKSRRQESSEDSSEDSDDSDSCLMCDSRNRTLLELPCGGFICSKCDKTARIMSPSRSGRRRKCLTSIQQSEIQDVIDLTEDSPLNVALRRKRNHSENDEVFIESAFVPSVTVLDDECEQANKKKKKRNRNKPAIVVNLEDTINLDETNKRNSGPVQEETNTPELSCPVCLENFVKDNNIKAMTTPCGHVFCESCLKEITTKLKKCSICKRTITFSKCIRLHI